MFGISLTSLHCFNIQFRKGNSPKFCEHKKVSAIQIELLDGVLFDAFSVCQKVSAHDSANVANEDFVLMVRLSKRIALWQARMMSPNIS